MRRFLIVGVLLGVMVAAFAACSDTGSDEETAALQVKADTYEIGGIEEQSTRPDHLRERSAICGHHRDSRRHRFQCRQSEPFVE